MPSDPPAEPPVDPKDRFTAAADDYHKYRPSYPAPLVDWIVITTGLAPGAPVADIGCGTGILTRILAERGFDPVGVDPNGEMLAHARRAGAGRYVMGSAEKTALATGAFDLAVSAQAFHWFDLEAALVEFRRIVRPGGWGGAVWNCRGNTPFLLEYDALLRRQSTEYDGIAKWDRSADAVRQAVSGWAPVREECPNSQELDWDGFLGRVRSSSYVIHGVSDREGFERALRGLYDRFQRDGNVEIAYRTLAVCWRFPRSPGSD